MPGVLFFHVALVALPDPQPVFCYVCVSALKSKRMDQSRHNFSFTSNGFKNWKDATINFKNHEASASHKEALQVVAVLRKFASRARKYFYGLTNPKMLPPPLSIYAQTVAAVSRLVLLSAGLFTLHCGSGCLQS